MKTFTQFIETMPSDFQPSNRPFLGRAGSKLTIADVVEGVSITQSTKIRAPTDWRHYVTGVKRFTGRDIENHLRSRDISSSWSPANLWLPFNLANLTVRRRLIMNYGFRT